MKKLLFKRLQKLDREINKIDEVLKLRNLCYSKNSVTIFLNNRRVKLDLKRQDARIKRKNLTKMRYLKTCEVNNFVKK